jgi:hypothetical protein
MQQIDRLRVRVRALDATRRLGSYEEICPGATLYVVALASIHNATTYRELTGDHLGRFNHACRF